MLQRVGRLPFLLEHLDGQTTLAVEGEIDAANIDAFEAILDVVAKAETGTVVVDLTDLDFMDVRGINALVRSRTTIESLGGSLVLRHPPPSVRRILEVLGPDMPVEPDFPEAAGAPNGQQDHRRQAPVTTGTLSKIIELAGTSREGWEQAVAAVVAQASQGILDLRMAELSELDIHIDNGSVVTYRAKVKISFTKAREVAHAPMTVQLNHTIVPARDKMESAAFLSEVLGLPEPFPFGPFMAVQVDSLTLDYVDVEDPEMESRHYAFLVSEEEFDEIFGRLCDREIPYWADPHANRPQKINTNDGGRGCYFPDPSGHLLEILTRAYGSGS